MHSYAKFNFDCIIQKLLPDSFFLLLYVPELESEIKKNKRKRREGERKR